MVYNVSFLRLAHSQILWSLCNENRYSNKEVTPKCVLALFEKCTNLFRIKNEHQLLKIKLAQRDWEFTREN